MNENIPKRKSPFALRGLSIQQRLPLLICALLLAIIISFSFASYYTVKKAAIQMGRERLSSLTNQLSSILAQSTTNMVTTAKTTANYDTVRDALVTDKKEILDGALRLLKKLRTDSTSIMIELMDTNFVSILKYSEAPEDLQVKLDAKFRSVSSSHDYPADKVGKISVINNSMYFPIIAEVTRKRQFAGYLVIWRLLATPQKSIDMLSELMGAGVTFYIGNNDGSFWTDMGKPSPNPPNIVKESRKYFEYEDREGDDVIAAVQPIPNSDWQVLIEYSRQSIIEGATRFLKWLIIIGGLLIVAGIFIAWLMSHNIIKPLKQLTKAATAISKGDYSLPVEVNRTDELGELANSFTIMQEKIQENQLNLEHKVLERTAQLESVNSELEAFSYSVSHDLRAPLRGIMGFTSMLEEDYSSKLDDEARRITGVIKANTLKMGNLIDDLLSFSRMGRHDIIKTGINTHEMVNEVIAGILPKNKETSIKWVIGTLPETYADINTMRQVWVNMVSNAIKYSRKNENPVIEIGSFIHEEQTAFYVRDNGVGFDNRYKDKLFKVFQRLHNPDEFEGTGIGLAIVEKTISKHGGKVWAEAETGQGATFYFSVPNA